MDDRLEILWVVPVKVHLWVRLLGSQWANLSGAMVVATVVGWGALWGLCEAVE